jgi:phosphatidylethanolamine/phosphatidyl-N-methylethanolamine N-methyltransferase
VVELGPGTGVFTGPLLNRLKDRGRLVAVEINANHADMLRRRFPECDVIRDTAENLRHHLDGARVDCVVSGLAWANMSPRTQNRILEAIQESLVPGGQFIAFAYTHAVWMPTSRRFRRQLAERFERLERTPVVWRNLPPAYVLRCWRG